MAQRIYITLNPPQTRYPIWIDRHTLSQVGTFIREVCPQASKMMMVTDSHVGPLYRDILRSALKEAGLAVHTVQIKPGEEFKTLETVNNLYEQAVRFGLKRQDCAVALGGGIVGDVTGFFAATYLRGIPFVQIPTTLLAQVDASVGGKVAVNLQSLKNMVGAFYQPQGVFIDTETLHTLPKREFACGMAEVIKYGLLELSIPGVAPQDESFFSFLETHATDITSVLDIIIQRCCTLKAAVVEIDPEERQGLREILNLGHTFAHAYETLSEGTIYHGEAVSIGLVLACRVATGLGAFSDAETQRVIQLLGRFGLPTCPPTDYSPEQVIAMIRHDKKALSSERLKLILPVSSVGHVAVQSDISQDDIDAVLRSS